MSLDDVVSLSITLNSSSPSKAGFGRQMIVGYHTHWTPGVLAKLYTSAADLLLDGFVATDAIYKHAVAIKSQNPCPKDFYVGKLTVAPTQIVELTPTTPAAGEVFSGKVNGKAFSHTADGTPTLPEACTGIAAAITTAAGGATGDGTSGTKVVSTTTAAGEVLEYTELTPNLLVKDVTADPATSISTQLTAIKNYKSDWYGLCPVNCNEAIAAVVAAWVESNRKLCAACVADSAVVDLPTASTTDVASDLHGLAYFRTGLFYRKDVGSVLATALMAQRFTATPGSDTWAHKRVPGSAPDALIASTQAAAIGKKANVYVDLGNGRGNTLWGTVASGEYFDQVRGIDALYAAIQEAVIAIFQANEKVPYTSSGIELIRGTIEGVMRKFAKAPYNFLVDDSTLFVTAPAVADVSAADKNARLLPNVQGHATLQGAVHMTEISVRLEV